MGRDASALGDLVGAAGPGEDEHLLLEDQFLARLGCRRRVVLVVFEDALDVAAVDLSNRVPVLPGAGLERALRNRRSARKRGVDTDRDGRARDAGRVAGTGRLRA